MLATVEEGLKAQMVTDLVQLCMVKGVVVKTNADKDDCNFEHMAISLFSTPFPLDKYNLAKDLQVDLGLMLG